ncbi:hypothetical protein ACROYT_G001446 [Oculina patagonica]
MFKPVTSRLDTQIEATKKLENKGVREGDPLPEYPIEPEDGGDEMPDFDPPPPINETQTEDEDEYEMPDFDPPPPIDEAQTEDEDEMPDFDPPPSIERKRKEWSPSSINKSKQKELDNERKYLAEERRRVNVLLGKLNKSGKNYVKTGKYRGLTYDDLLKQSDNFTKQINNIENQLLLTKQKIQRMEYKRVPFTSFDLQESSKKLKKTPKSKSKIKSKPTIVKSLFDKIDAIRKDTAPDSDSDREEVWEEASKKKNEGTVYFNLYGDMEPLSAKPKFKVGDKVRISKYKRIVFDKGYTPNWSEEMFVITKIQHTNPITYKLKDLRDEEIQGSFYEPELLKAKQDVFRIDKVIRRDYKKKHALVKWKGYNDDFNSWIPMKDLQHI